MILPPVGMASRALTIRFMITCSIWPASPRVEPSAPASRVVSSMSSPISRCSICSSPAITALRLSTVGWMIWRRLNASSWLVSVAARSAAFWISSWKLRTTAGSSDVLSSSSRTLE